MRRFVTALQFLTLLKIRDQGYAPGDLDRSMVLFPLVGALQGGVLVAVDLAAGMVLPASLSTALVLIALYAVNGGFHLDGFADTVDALAGGRTPEARLRIMKDSATGAVGVLSVVLLVLFKYLSVSELTGAARYGALVAFPAVGRWSMVVLARFSKSAKKEGLGAEFTNAGPGAVFYGTIFTLAVVASALGTRALWTLLPVALLALAACLFFRNRLGGVTGDVFGFVSELAEALFLALVVAAGSTGAVIF